MKSVDVVGAVILNQQNEVLCAQRGLQMSLAGQWEFPGGKIEPGEDPRATLVREIQEEMGCTIAVHDLIVDTTYDYPGIRVRLLTYYASIVSGNPTALEHAALAWVPRPLLGSLEWAAADIPTVERLTRA